MAITFLTFGVSPGANSASCVIVKPSGLAVGDFMIAHVMSKVPATAITPPANWTLAGAQVQTAAGRSGVFWKFAIAADVAAASFTFTVGSQSNRGGIARYTGVDPTTPVEAVNQQANAADYTIETPLITTLSANAQVLIFGGSDQEGWSDAFSGSDPTCTEVWELITGLGTDCSSHLWHGPKAVAGQIGAQTITMSISAGSAGHAVALRSGAASFSYTGSGLAQSGGAALPTKTKAVMPTGGAQSAGSAALSRTKTWLASGGALAAGVAVVLFCRTFTFSSEGGAQSAGTVSIAITKAYSGSGGGQSAGAAELSRTKTYTASGLAQSAGAAETQYVAESQVWQYAASGGAQSGGAADHAKTKTYPASVEGAQANGAAGIAKTKAYAGAGGAQTSGWATCGFVSCYTYASSGGAQSAGAALVAKTKAWTSSGGAIVAGTAQTDSQPAAAAYVYAASGGAQAGGSAETTYVPAIQEYVYVASGGAQSGGTAGSGTVTTPPIPVIRMLVVPFEARFLTPPAESRVLVVGSEKLRSIRA